MRMCTFLGCEKIYAHSGDHGRWDHDARRYVDLPPVPPEPEYLRVEMSFAAVATEDLERLSDDFIALRDRYCRGGSSIGIRAMQDHTVINRPVVK